jgi:hypothetical protein
MKKRFRIECSTICRRKYLDEELHTATTGASGVPTL